MCCASVWHCLHHGDGDSHSVQPAVLSVYIRVVVLWSHQAQMPIWTRKEMLVGKTGSTQESRWLLAACLQAIKSKSSSLLLVAQEPATVVVPVTHCCAAAVLSSEQLMYATVIIAKMTCARAHRRPSCRISRVATSRWQGRAHEVMVHAQCTRVNLSTVRWCYAYSNTVQPARKIAHGSAWAHSRSRRLLR